MTTADIASLPNLVTSDNLDEMVARAADMILRDFRLDVMQHLGCSPKADQINWAVYKTTVLMAEAYAWGGSIPNPAPFAELLATTPLPTSHVDWALDFLGDVSLSTAAVWIYLADRAIATGRVSVPLADCAARLDLDIDQVEESVDALCRLGLVSAWTFDGQSCATLSPLSAERLGLKLQSGSSAGTLGWVSRSKRDPPVRRRSKIRTATDLQIRLELLASDSLRPDQIAEARETVEDLIHDQSGAKKKRLPDTILANPPRPFVLITGSATVWQETSTGKCSACGSAESHSTIHGSTICLRCHRYSFDWILDRLKRSAAAAAIAEAKAPKPTFAQLHHPREAS